MDVKTTFLNGNLLKDVISHNLRVLRIQRKPEKYVNYRGPLMDFNKHRGVGIFILIRRSKSLVLPMTKMSPVCIRGLVGALSYSLCYM